MSVLRSLSSGTGGLRLTMHRDNIDNSYENYCDVSLHLDILYDNIDFFYVIPTLSHVTCYIFNMNGYLFFVTRVTYLLFSKEVHLSNTFLLGHYRNQPLTAQNRNSKEWEERKPVI